MTANILFHIHYSLVISIIRLSGSSRVYLGFLASFFIIFYFLELFKLFFFSLQSLLLAIFGSTVSSTLYWRLQTYQAFLSLRILFCYFKKQYLPRTIYSHNCFYLWKCCNSKIIFAVTISILSIFTILNSTSFSSILQILFIFNSLV